VPSPYANWPVEGRSGSLWAAWKRQQLGPVRSTDRYPRIHQLSDHRARGALGLFVIPNFTRPSEFTKNSDRTHDLAQAKLNRERLRLDGEKAMAEYTAKRQALIVNAARLRELRLAREAAARLSPAKPAKRGAAKRRAARPTRSALAR